MFNGFFGGLFDSDGNGELDAMEQAAEFGFLDLLTNDSDDAADADYDTLDDN